MISYDASNPMDFVRFTGSVAPAAMWWAIPCSILSILYHKAIHSWTSGSDLLDAPESSETTAWSMFTSILGFLIVFRAQLSYARYWEGITLVERACGVWLNGCSNLIAFCSTKPELQDQVEEFQYILSRLFSMAFCFSMSDISGLDRERFPHLGLDGIDPTSIEYIHGTSAKQYVALQWIQRLVVENARTGVIDIAPPILSRVFQEFSIGIVHFVDAQKISTVHFPFPFAQMVFMLLVFFSILPVPMVCAVGMNIYKSAFYTFLITFVFWSVHYIAVEIELPFGEDANDLPLEDVNRRFNKILMRLTEMRAQQTPRLVQSSEQPNVQVRHVVRQSTQNLDDMDKGGISGAIPRLLRTAARLRRAASAARGVDGLANENGDGEQERVQEEHLPPLREESEPDMDVQESPWPAPPARPVRPPRPPPDGVADEWFGLEVVESAAGFELPRFPVGCPPEGPPPELRLNEAAAESASGQRASNWRARAGPLEVGGEQSLQARGSRGSAGSEASGGGSGEIRVVAY